MLINCPNCGKPVSDKAKQCVHCDYVINSTFVASVDNIRKKEQKKEFFNLEYYEREELLMLFGNEEPLQNKVIRLEKTHLVLQFIFGGLAILLTIIGIIILLTIGKNALNVQNPQVSDFILAFGTIVVAMLFWIVFVLFIIIRKARRQKFIIASKHFEEWLNKHGIEGFAEMLMDDAVEMEKLEELNNN